MLSLICSLLPYIGQGRPHKGCGVSHPHCRHEQTFVGKKGKEEGKEERKGKEGEEEGKKKEKKKEKEN